MEITDLNWQDFLWPHPLGQIHKAGYHITLVGAGRGAGIKDTFLDEELIQANCEDRQVLTGVGRKEGSRVSTDPRPDPHSAQVPGWVPHPSPVCILSFLPEIQNHQ